ncbi:MAG TPA: ferritin family protein, partial [Synergistaceae bacterium]|nr:ferritin family protein [Synergistaceae bacterium]
MNVFELAMVKELEVKAYYEKLADEATLPGVKNIFMLLAADEQKHYDAVRELKERSGTEKITDSPALVLARKVLAGFFGDPAPASKMKNSLESYRKALLVEAESVGFYEELLGREEDGHARAAFSAILEQER